MSSRELSPEWVLSSFISPLAGSQDEISELVVVARRLWPRIQAHARREQPEKSSDEALALATEVWEGVLQSVAKTIQRSNRRTWRIKNTEAYLFGAFHHRFNRALRKERTRRETIQCLPNKVLATEYQTVLPDEKLIAKELERSRRELDKRASVRRVRRKQSNPQRDEDRDDSWLLQRERLTLRDD
jgi:DNA-directed RNA polymerase specialized sigma24 family protein